MAHLKKRKIKRSDLAARLRERYRLSKLQSNRIVQIFVREITQALKNNHRVEIRGLGSLWVADYKPRLAFNPRTRTKVPLPLRRLVRYRKSSVLNPKPIKEKP